MRFPGPEAKEAGFEASTTRGSRGKRRFFSTRRTSRSSIPPLDDEVVPCIGEGLASSSCKPPAMPLASSAQASGRRSPASTEVHLCVPVGGRESAGVCSGAGGNGVGSPCACTRALEAQLMWNDWNDTGAPDACGVPRHRKNRLQCKVPWGEGAAHIKEKSQARPGKEATGAEETVGCQHGATRSGVRATRSKRRLAQP